VGTIYMMIFNGMLIGVIGTACFYSGMSLQLWSFVAPHGVLELPAIFIAAGGATAGTRTAVSWVLAEAGFGYPGRRRVRQAILGTIPFCS